MLDFYCRLKVEQWIGLLFVMLLHGLALYGLWSYRMIPTHEEGITLMVNLINSATPDKFSRIEPPKLKAKPHHVEPPKPPPLVSETPVVRADDLVAPLHAPAPVAVPVPAPVASVMPAQPVALSGELSLSCPERSAPNYPSSSMRLNEQGRVVLRVELGVDGKIAGVTFKTHSGFMRLDEAAANAVKSWRCKPALRNGVAVPAVALQPFEFILEGR